MLECTLIMKELLHCLCVHTRSINVVMQCTPVPGLFEHRYYTLLVHTHIHTYTHTHTHTHTYTHTHIHTHTHAHTLKTLKESHLVQVMLFCHEVVRSNSICRNRTRKAWPSCLALVSCNVSYYTLLVSMV